MNENNNGRGYSVTVAVIVASLIFIALVWKMREYTTPAPLGAERAAERAKALHELRAAEADALNNVGWIDQTKGLVRIPIAEAMKLRRRRTQHRFPGTRRETMISQ